MSVTSLIYGLSQGEDHGFTTPAAIVAFVLSALLAVLFVLAERKAAAPMLPLTVFADPARRAALAAMLVMGGVLAGYLYFVSLYLQDSLGFGALTAGLALVPATATVMATSILLTRRLLPRLGVKRMLLLGLAAIGAGQAWLSQITAGGSYAVNVLGGILLTAFGLGIAFPNCTPSPSPRAYPPASKASRARFLFVTAQQESGAAAGLAALATIADARTRSAHGSLVAGYRLSFLVAAGASPWPRHITARQLRLRARPPPPVPGTLAPTPDAVAVPTRPAVPAVTGPEPEPADQCPLSLCGLGGDAHVSGDDTPARRAVGPATG